ncbi:hypothetical protein KAR91_21235 [Candidatus Pacearchaeota archaeon]|nr:hypothetical protein [Candidatus Pacearchaeota archaeon]
MKVEIKGGECIVTKEKGDCYFSGVRNAAGESRLLYHLKKHLNAQGYDLIKKRMAKDGHMVDSLQQYLRSRLINKRSIAIYNMAWAIEGADEILNRDGQVKLVVVPLTR